MGKLRKSGCRSESVIVLANQNGREEIEVSQLLAIPGNAAKTADSFDIVVFDGVRDKTPEDWCRFFCDLSRQGVLAVVVASERVKVMRTMFFSWTILCLHGLCWMNIPQLVFQMRFSRNAASSSTEPPEMIVLKKENSSLNGSSVWQGKVHDICSTCILVLS